MAFWCCNPCSHRIRRDLWHGDSQGRLLCCHRPRVCLQAQRPRRRASWASSLASRVELCWQLTFSSDPVLLWFTCCSYYLHNHNCYLHDRESRGQRAREAPRSSLTLITCVLPWSAGARPVPRILPLAASLQLAWPYGLRFRYASSGNHAVACHTFPRPAMTCRVACSAFVSTLRTGGGGRGTVPLAPRGAHLWAPRPTRDAAAARPAPEGSCHDEVGWCGRVAGVGSQRAPRSRVSVTGKPARWSET